MNNTRNGNDFTSTTSVEFDAPFENIVIDLIIKKFIHTQN